MKDYQQIIGDLTLMYGITVCFSCKCRGAGYEMGHSRAHAHTEQMKICLDAVPKGFVSFFTALHEMGHCLALRGAYSSSYPRALAEHNATEWAKAELKKLGIPMKRKVKKGYDEYIGEKVARGLRRGLQVVPAELRRYKAKS